MKLVLEKVRTMHSWSTGLKLRSLNAGLDIGKPFRPNLATALLHLSYHFYLVSLNECLGTSVSQTDCSEAPVLFFLNVLSFMNQVFCKI